ncbi:MAG: methyl-accepting chemotaxis protein, partial [Verrucomicrobiae bacterium]|nr:methyl-accepting chemotaxis protein [Verrucomicrobiae bacterium]
MKLRVKLILSYLAIVFLNAGLIMTMAIRSSSRTVADAVSSDLRHVAMGAAEQINLMMAKLIHVAEVTSRSTVLGVTDAKLKGSYLRETLERNPEWNTISEFDFQGNVSASTEASTGGKSFRELYPESTEFFEKAKKLKQGEFLFRDAYLPIGETTPRFLILVPVYSSAASGAPSVLVFESILHAIKERVFNLDEKTPGGYPAYLVNREGAVLATQDKTAIPLKPLPEVKSHQNLANAISSDENGSLRLRNSKGDDVIIAYADVDQWGANTSGDWAVLTIASEKHVLAPVIRLRHTLIATSVLVCVIACLLGVYVAGRIDQPVQSLIRKTTEIAHTGDLTQKIELKSNGEMGLLGRAFDTMLESLRKLISQVVNAGFQITSATTQLRSSAAQQASGAVKQSSTTSQLIATVEELAQSAAQIAVSAEQLSRNADVTAKSIEAIHERVAETARRVLDLGQKSEGIGVITTAIDDLADQTHLLALNAAI